MRKYYARNCDLTESLSRADILSSQKFKEHLVLTPPARGGLEDLPQHVEELPQNFGLVLRDGPAGALPADHRLKQLPVTDGQIELFIHDPAAPATAPPKKKRKVEAQKWEKCDDPAGADVAYFVSCIEGLREQLPALMASFRRISKSARPLPFYGYHDVAMPDGGTGQGRPCRRGKICQAVGPEM